MEIQVEVKWAQVVSLRYYNSGCRNPHWQLIRLPPCQLTHNQGWGHVVLLDSLGPMHVYKSSCGSTGMVVVWWAASVGFCGLGCNTAMTTTWAHLTSIWVSVTCSRSNWARSDQTKVRVRLRLGLGWVGSKPGWPQLRYIKTEPSWTWFMFG